MTPRPKCGTSVTWSGAVLAKAQDSSRRRARARAEEQALRRADRALARAWKAQCPKSCSPGKAVGDAGADVAHLRCVEVASKRWVAYVVASWQVEISCPPR